MRRIIVNKWDIILVKWIDAASNSNWRAGEDLELVPYRVNTAGMFIGEDDLHWLICLNHGWTSGNMADTIQIPKGMIEHVEILKRAETI